jgi:hypothetical protein
MFKYKDCDNFKTIVKFFEKNKINAVKLGFGTGIFNEVSVKYQLFLLENNPDQFYWFATSVKNRTLINWFLNRSFSNNNDFIERIAQNENLKSKDFYYIKDRLIDSCILPPYTICKTFLNILNNKSAPASIIKELENYLLKNIPENIYYEFLLYTKNKSTLNKLLNNLIIKDILQ